MPVLNKFSNPIEKVTLYNPFFLPLLMCHGSTGVDANTDTKNMQKKPSKMAKERGINVLDACLVHIRDGDQVCWVRIRYHM